MSIHDDQQPTMGLSEAELQAMTRDLDSLHHDVSLPALKESVDEWTEENHQAGEEGVALPQVPDAGVFPAVEHLVRIVPRRRAVPVDQDDPAARGGQGKGGAQPPDAGADDDHGLGHAAIPGRISPWAG